MVIRLEGEGEESEQADFNPGKKETDKLAFCHQYFDLFPSSSGEL